MHNSPSYSWDFELKIIHKVFKLKFYRYILSGYVTHVVPCFPVKMDAEDILCVWNFKYNGINDILCEPIFLLTDSED